jgi:hypothetical protein
MDRGKGQRQGSGQNDAKEEKGWPWRDHGHSSCRRVSAVSSLKRRIRFPR